MIGAFVLSTHRDQIEPGVAVPERLRTGCEKQDHITHLSSHRHRWGLSALPTPFDIGVALGRPLPSLPDTIFTRRSTESPLAAASKSMIF
jgi:hypothetical protein